RGASHGGLRVVRPREGGRLGTRSPPLLGPGPERLARGRARLPRPPCGGDIVARPRRRGAILDVGMAYNAWFSCINGCPGEYDLREVIYRCPTCGDLLEVQH